MANPEGMAHEEKSCAVRSGSEDPLSTVLTNIPAPIAAPLMSLPQLTPLSSQHQATCDTRSPNSKATSRATPVACKPARLTSSSGIP